MTDLQNRVACVITVSDRCARGAATDRSGPQLADLIRASGFAMVHTDLVPDGVASVQAAIRRGLGLGSHLVVTTGGTGVGPRDLTPEATAPLLVQLLPGLAEEIRRRGAAKVPAALLSRGLAGLAARPVTGPAMTGPAVTDVASAELAPQQRSLVVNLPGSPGGARDGWAVLEPLVGHVLDQTEGGLH